MFINYCKIGQLDLCRQKGCEFNRVMHQHCPSSPNFRPVEVIIGKKKKKKQDVAKPSTPSPIKKNDDDSFIEKIMNPKQDPWITKIKTI
jgi:hypothetical protein